MRPVLTVEFKTKPREKEFEEESVALHKPEELFAFIAPGGGCDNIPDEVCEIQMVFLPPEHTNTNNRVADLPAVLELGMVIISGPLSEISQTAEQIMDRAGRDELSAGFCRVIGLES